MTNEEIKKEMKAYEMPSIRIVKNSTEYWKGIAAVYAEEDPNDMLGYDDVEEDIIYLLPHPKR